MRSKWTYRVFIIVFTLVSFETLLRVFKINMVWSERVGQGYVSGYNRTYPTWFYGWSPNAEFDVDQKDFKYHYKTNHLGIRERETFYTDTGAMRILCLGDSYTEGLGAPYDSSYPRLLETSLNASGFHNQVYNAGISSTDPFHAYMLLKEKLLPAKPQYVLITFNSSDLSEFVFLGGLERFKPDSTVQGRKGPWYEPVYQHSYVCRFFINVIWGKINYNLFLTKHEYRNVVCPQAVHEIANVFDSINRLGKEQGFELMVVVQPIAHEIVDKFENNLFTKEVFSSMVDSLTIRDIKVINTWPVLEGKITPTNEAQFAHLTDHHFTPAGYSLFANSLLKAIDEKYPGYWK